MTKPGTAEAATPACVCGDGDADSWDGDADSWAEDAGSWDGDADSWDGDAGSWDGDADGWDGDADGWATTLLPEVERGVGRSWERYAAPTLLVEGTAGEAESACR